MWSKWKRFHSPQSARVILYLGHANWETGDAKWHHYSAKCPPSSDFLCISAVLFKTLFIHDGNLQSSKIKGGWCGRDCMNLIWCSWGFALLSEDQTSHSLIWSDLGGTLKWGHRDYRGWLVSKWLGYEWEHSLHRKYQTRVDSCFWIIHQKKSGDAKMLLSFTYYSFGHQKDSVDHSISNA